MRSTSLLPRTQRLIRPSVDPFADSAERRYRIYGETVRTTAPFRFFLREAEPEADARLSFVLTTEPKESAGLESYEQVYTQPATVDEGAASIYRDGASVVLRLHDKADFYLEAEQIVCHLLDPAYAYAVEIWLLGSVFSLWSELHARPALHSAAVVIDGHAMAVMATSKGGKSSLATALMKGGASLLTDDILIVDRIGTRLVGHPSYPQMRLWPDQAAHVLGSAAAESLPQVVPHLSKRFIPVGRDGFGTFQSASTPISCLVLPERRSDVTAVRLVRIPPAEALIALIQHSFLPRVTDQLGLAPRRLPVLVDLARRAHAYRLVYPDGIDHLPRVADALFALR